MISDDLQQKAESAAAYEKLLDSATAFLKTRGVEPLVIGGVAIQHRPNDHSMNHRLVLLFTASHVVEQS